MSANSIKTLQPLRAGVLLIALCLIGSVLPDRFVHVLQYDRAAILSGEAWRLWSGHFVHLSTEHMAANALALGLLAAMIAAYGHAKKLVHYTLLGAPVISLGLVYLAPNMAVYRGASGLVTLYFVLVCCLVWQNSSPYLRGPMVMLTLAAILKLVLDTEKTEAGMGLITTLPTGVQIAWQAHLLGAMLGLAVFVLSKITPLWQIACTYWRAKAGWISRTVIAAWRGYREGDSY